MTSLITFLEGLIATSEKAAQIARIIRLAYIASDGANSIATEEKSGGRLNGDTDFKTLADVLCQSVIDSDLKKLFPEIKSIRGEENGNFQTHDSSNLCIEIKNELTGTSKMLEKALPNNTETVDKLSSLIHSAVSVPSKIRDELAQCKGSLNLSDISIWIDPIDATKEYVRAKKPFIVEGVNFKGLPCITVLIGVYNNSNGSPIAGVISRPFTITDTDICSSANPSTRWRNEIYWACTVPNSGLSFTSSSCAHTSTEREKLRIAMSAGERMPFIVNNPNYEMISPKGAGNKIMTVVNGFTDLYLITIESNVVFRWDTCAGHAILKASGGGIVSYKHTLDALASYQGDMEDFPFSDYEIDYRGGDDPLVHGIVAYSEPKHLFRLYSDLLEHVKSQTSP